MGGYGPQPIPVKHRIRGSVKLNDAGCWILKRSLNGGGYPRIWDGYRVRVAHRVSYEVFIGAIPNGLYVLHKCDNKRCVNPKHLFTGTQSDNMKDSSKKGRISYGDSHHTSKLNAIKVRQIRGGRAFGFSNYSLAKHHGVHESTIRDVISGRTWKWVK